MNCRAYYFFSRHCKNFWNSIFGKLQSCMIFLVCTRLSDKFKNVSVLHKLNEWTLWKWGHLTVQNPPLKCCQPLKLLKNFVRGLDLSIQEILESVGQRAANLLAIKLWELFDPGQTRTLAEHTCTYFGWNGLSDRIFLENSSFDS